MKLLTAFILFLGIGSLTLFADDRITISPLDVLPVERLAELSEEDKEKQLEARQEKIEGVLKKLALLPTNTPAKFAVKLDQSAGIKSMAISTTGKKSPKHDNLADGKENALTGGYITVTFTDDDKAAIAQVTLDNYSGRLCPSYPSLSIAYEILSAYVPEGAQILLVNNPNSEKCD